MKFDLHCHSTASDGKLSPEAVLLRAEEAQVELFALTDHDTVAGSQAIASLDKKLQFVSGIELSAVWSGVLVHIVGLDFDPNHTAILSMIAILREAREQRAYMIDKKLASLGMPNTLQGALTFCPDIGQVGRPHFAEYLVQQGYVENATKAFDAWLGNGKVCDIKTQWPEMAACIRSIVDADGVAVLAHPLRYKLTLAKLKRLIDAFAAAGGRAVEVSTAQPIDERHSQLCHYVQQKQLAGSGGADFHDPHWHWAQIGHIPPIPKDIQPVWQLFQRTKVCV
jgi:3',5'-nucleoside bisphosphate phosphatase